MSSVSSEQNWIMKTKRIKEMNKYEHKGKFLFLYIILLILTLLLIFYYVLNYPLNKKSNARYEKPSILTRNLRINQDQKLYSGNIKFEGEKIVHIDLKGAPLKISYYDHFLELIAQLGATGILLEYEDMFPYRGPMIGNISAEYAYTLDDIKKINELAKRLKLKVIPLVQTFGHLEFILKLRKFAYLREEMPYPQVICPSHNNTLYILKEMIKQVMEAHPDSDIIHLGADEVYFLGKCEKCIERMRMQNWTKQKLFLSHVTVVSRMVKDMYPKVRILVWDDKFRNAKPEDFEDFEITKLVEPVVWKYTRDVTRTLEPELWDMYADIFPRIWIASAYKGATGSNKYIPNIRYHLDNHISWMRIVMKYSQRIKFEGIMLTGWQRYDHFAILCELLPAGIPSLAICLDHLQGNVIDMKRVPKVLVDVLRCDNPYGIFEPSYGLPLCIYPGLDIYEYLLKFKSLQKDFNELFAESVVKGWLTDYNMKNSYSNIFLIESISDNLDIFRLKFLEIEKSLRTSMQSIYDNYTINEWIETYLKPFGIQIEKLWNGKELLLSESYWPRRPFKNDL